MQKILPTYNANATITTITKIRSEMYFEFSPPRQNNWDFSHLHS